MPRLDGRGYRRLCLCLVLVVLLFGFAPISRGLLRIVDGSFAPTGYSSLALSTPSDAAVGILAGEALPVQLSNHTGHVETYHWSATQSGALISLGEETLGNGRTTTISVPSRGAVAGRLRVALTGTKVYVSVQIVGL